MLLFDNDSSPTHVLTSRLVTSVLMRVSRAGDSQLLESITCKLRGALQMKQ